MATGLNIQKQLEAQVKQIEKQTQSVANQTLWQTLKEIQPKAEEKLREIIEEKFYRVRDFDPRYNNGFYDRTYQFRDCAIVKPAQGGGHYTMQVWLDINALEAREPQKSDKRMFWSYAYSWGAEDGLRSVPLDLGEKQQLVNYWDKEYGITAAFDVWFRKEFPELFEKNFDIRMRKVFNYKTW